MSGAGNVGADGWKSRAKSIGGLLLCFIIPVGLLNAAYHWGRSDGYKLGAADMRDAIMCVLERTSGELPQRYCAAMTPPRKVTPPSEGEG